MIQLELPQLDQVTREQIDTIHFDFNAPHVWGATEEEYALRHELVNYGFDAVSHAIFTKLWESRETLSTKDFIRQLGLKFSRYGDDDRSVLIPLSSLESQGLHIPTGRRTYGHYRFKEYEKVEEPHLNLFETDYENKVKSERWIDETYDSAVYYPQELTHRLWRPYDFENPHLLTLAKKFVHDLWEACERGIAKGTNDKQGDVVDLTYSLRGYYRKIMECCGYQQENFVDSDSDS